MVADLIEAVLLLRFLPFFHVFMKHGLKRSSYRLTFSLGYPKKKLVLIKRLCFSHSCFFESYVPCDLGLVTRVQQEYIYRAPLAASP